MKFKILQIGIISAIYTILTSGLAHGESNCQMLSSQNLLLAQAQSSTICTPSDREIKSTFSNCVRSANTDLQNKLNICQRLHDLYDNDTQYLCKMQYQNYFQKARTDFPKQIEKCQQQARQMKSKQYCDLLLNGNCTMVGERKVCR
jgi:hypothetical protein